MKGHNWLTPNASHISSPMSNNATTLREIHTSSGPTDAILAAELQRQIGFRCRQAIGELMFAAVTCRPDILYSTMLLS